jgi:hypothetical protein
MKTIVIHGDHSDKISQRVTNLIAQGKKRKMQIFRYAAGEDPVSERISSVSLFGNQLHVIEKTGKLSSADTGWLSNNLSRIDGQAVFYNEGYLPPKVLKIFPKSARVETYKLPRAIFNLLDSFYPKNQKRIVQLTEELKKKEAAEFVLALLARRLKDLYVIISEPSLIKLEGWRRQKYMNQAKMFTTLKLKSLIKKLSVADITSKSSKESLWDLLDQLILTQLE